MYKSLLYKEWLKIRYFLIGYGIAIVFMSGYLFLDIRHILSMNKPNEVLNYIVQFKALLYEMIKYIPVLGGLLLALTQFVPEMTKNRFRLSFHLPLPEVKMLLFVISGGFAIFLLANLVFYGLILLTVAIFFPAEVVVSAAVTILPWFLAGLGGYFATTTVIVEHSWKYRLVTILIATGLIGLMLNENGYGEHVFILGQYILIIFLFALTVIFPGYRLRKGSR
jgi:hypothetical protein